MKLSDLKVGDKFRFLSSGSKFEFIDARSCGHWEFVCWSNCGYRVFTTDHEVELITDPPEPQYRPYSDLRCMLGAKVRHKVNRCEYIVTQAQTSYCKFANAVESPDDMLQNYEYLDGTPCGELVSENSN